MELPVRRWTFALTMLAALLFQGCARPRVSPDAEFQRTSEEYLKGHLAWRPASGMALGLHEYDGRITDFSRASLDAELRRLKQFDARLARLSPKNFTREAAFDYRLLQANIRAEIFGFEQVESFTRNPMTYAQAIDLTQYVKRDFAPLSNRVYSIVAIEKQTPALFTAARMNLRPGLPKPFIETAIDVAEGQMAFLEKDLPLAVKEVNDSGLLKEFNAANRIALTELSNFVAWLKSERLPQADNSFALGREKYREMMRLSEFVELTPQQ
ncbi:MAG TPA: DUF885 family protein, partial [Verrucomicrobiae bacterium]